MSAREIKLNFVERAPGKAYQVSEMSLDDDEPEDKEKESSLDEDLEIDKLLTKFIKVNPFVGKNKKKHTKRVKKVV